jgi:hypothetical protein
MGLDSWKSHCKNSALPYKIKSICDVGCLMTSYSLVASLELRYNGINDKITPPDSN